MPQGATFGVDQNAWAVGSKFNGVKMIPPGTHFISYGASDTFGTSATTISFFTFFKPQQVIVRKWDTSIEDFVDIEDEDQRDRYIAGVKRFEFDAGLGAYPYEKYQEWQALSSFITEDFVIHLEPTAKRISSAASSESAEEERKILEQLHNFQLRNSEAKKQNKEQDEQMEPPPLENPSNTSDSSDPSPTHTTTNKTKKIDLIEYCPKFTPIPKRAAEKGATPQEITQQNLDKSNLLRKILETSYPQDNNMLLGELQYAFTTFFFGHSYEGFRQWKELLVLLTNCESAMRTNSQFFCNFIDVVTPQIELIPQDFFYDNISGNNFIKQIFKGFFENVTEPGIERQLTLKGKQLQTKMEKRFQISFSIEEFEDEEDAPVLVVMDE